MAFAVTGFELLAIKVRFMAGIAGWNISMRSMAIVTRQLGMLAWEFLQLFERRTVADRAGIYQCL